MRKKIQSYVIFFDNIRKVEYLKSSGEIRLNDSPFELITMTYEEYLELVDELCDKYEDFIFYNGIGVFLRKYIKINNSFGSIEFGTDIEESEKLFNAILNNQKGKICLN